LKWKVLTEPGLLFPLHFDGQAEVGQLDCCALLLAGQEQVFRLEISVHHSVHVAVIDALQDLLDAVRRVGLGVELPGDNVLEEFAAGHAETNRFKFNYNKRRVPNLT